MKWDEIFRNRCLRALTKNLRDEIFDGPADQKSKTRPRANSLWPARPFSPATPIAANPLPSMRRIDPFKFPSPKHSRSCCWHLIPPCSALICPYSVQKLHKEGAEENMCHQKMGRSVVVPRNDGSEPRVYGNIDIPFNTLGQDDLIRTGHHPHIMADSGKGHHLFPTSDPIACA